MTGHTQDPRALVTSCAVYGTALDKTRLELTEHASYAHGTTLRVYDVVR